MRRVTMRWTVALGFVGGLAIGCDSESRGVVRGQVSPKGFDLNEAHVAAIEDNGTTWLAPLTSDGRFSVQLPRNTRLTLRFARPTDQPDVYDAFAVMVTPLDGVTTSPWFSMPFNRKRIDLGAIVPRRNRATLTARQADGEDDDDGTTEDDDEGNECAADEDDDDGNGRGAVEDNDDEEACGPVDPPPGQGGPPDGGAPPPQSPQVIVLRDIFVCDVQQGADLLEVVAQHPGHLNAEHDGNADELDLTCQVGSGHVAAKASPGVARDE